MMPPHAGATPAVAAAAHNAAEDPMKGAMTFRGAFSVEALWFGLAFLRARDAL